MSTCPYYQNRCTKKEKLFGKEKLVCNQSECQYGNGDIIEYGGERIAMICKTKGLVKKLQVLSLEKI